jgi:hypothetical protein
VAQHLPPPAVVSVETATTPDRIDEDGQITKGVPAFRVVTEIYYSYDRADDTQLLRIKDLLEAMEHSRDSRP